MTRKEILTIIDNLIAKDKIELAKSYEALLHQREWSPTDQSFDPATGESILLWSSQERELGAEA